MRNKSEKFDYKYYWIKRITIIIIITVFLRNLLISVGLERVLGPTEKSCINYKQFSNKTVSNTIRGKEINIFDEQLGEKSNI